MPRLPLVLSALLLTSLPALAQTCPAPLADAHKLVLVTARDMASTSATVQRFSRANPHEPWKPDGGPVSAIIGHNGMGWAHAFRSFAKEGEPVKVDGDKKVPAGFYKIGRPFGFERSPLKGYLRLAAGDVCVDDPRSRAYNTITTRAKVGEKVHGENMWRVPDYVRGLVVDYPTDAHAKAGSCIFIHAWLPGKTGTAGCVAVRTPAVMKLQEFAQGGAVLAVLPKQALDRFKGCLPAE
jgi:L,D-peptidoglycan transpeptidase YkuD (ErfK/YbiS/YcfS/YnhG family)